MDETILIEKAYVEISGYRKRTLQSIGEELKIPTQIARDAGILPNHISKTLKELKDHDLAVCVNEEMRKGRLYKLTDKGKMVLLSLKMNS